MSVIGAAQCLFLSTLYVLSLYLWSCTHGRNHPSTIKRRFFSAFLMCIVSPVYLYFCLSEESLDKATLLEHMGLKLPGLIQAISLPLLLTAILFLGPITMFTIAGVWNIYLEPTYWLNCWMDLIWLRNHIVAPFSEEFVYRASMMPILLQTLSPGVSIITSPFVFGLAHFHHAVEKLWSGHDLFTTVRDSCFQFAYTTLFGAYSAFLFARTGHFAAPFLAHAFCNHMGFPNFAAIRHYPPVQQIVIVVMFITGLISWYYLLYPLTEPSYYSNTLHWS